MRYVLVGVVLLGSMGKAHACGVWTLWDDALGRYAAFLVHSTYVKQAWRTGLAWSPAPVSIAQSSVTMAGQKVGTLRGDTLTVGDERYRIQVSPAEDEQTRTRRGYVVSVAVNGERGLWTKDRKAFPYCKKVQDPIAAIRARVVQYIVGWHRRVLAEATAAAAKTVVPKQLEALQEDLRSTHSWRRFLAALVVGRLGSKGAPVLSEVLATATSREVLCDALFAARLLGKRSRPLRPRVEQLARSGDRYVREAAVRVLEVIADRSGIPH